MVPTRKESVLQKQEKRNTVLHLLDVYRSYPELWDMKSPGYADRIRKAAAYEKLIPILRTIDPNATRKTVVRKINDLRTAFRKEQKIVNQTNQAPVLWFYDKLLFLDDVLPPGKRSTKGTTATGGGSGSASGEVSKDSVSINTLGVFTIYIY